MTTILRICLIVFVIGLITLVDELIRLATSLRNKLEEVKPHDD